MKFSTTLMSSFLCATTILAARPGRLAEQVQRRAAHRRREDQIDSNPLLRAEGVKYGPNGDDITNQTSYNWSGSSIISPPTNQTFFKVQGSFVVPTPKPPTTGPGSWYGSAWVGIDGQTWIYGLLQTGVTWEVTVNSTGGAASYTYFAWCEWYPSGGTTLNLEVSAGDTLNVLVQSYTNSSGICTVANQSTGKSASLNATAPGDGALAGQNADWIVEDLSLGGNFAPFADFGEVLFTGAVASATGGALFYPDSGTEILLLDSHGNLTTSVSFPAGAEDSMLVEYI